MSSFMQYSATKNRNVRVSDVEPAYKVVDGKKKRVKQVLPNAQLCHVWAQQTQDYGRNSKDSLYFHGDSIYSYGPHFLAAKIFTLKNGKRIALINSRRYSMATGMQLNHIQSALDGLMPVFHVPNPSKLDSIDNVNYFYNRIYTVITSLFSTVKVSSKNDIKWGINSLDRSIKEANTYFDLIGHKPVIVDQDTRDAIRWHLKRRLKRYQELNSPTIIAERQRLARENFNKKNADKIAKYKESLKCWLSNSTMQANLPWDLKRILDLKNDLVRITSNEIQTTSGARVPREQGLRFYKAIVSGSAYIGMQVGEFTLDSITKVDNDTIIKVGCHTFSLNQVAPILDKATPQLKLA
jgi:hypothetical protein